MVTFMKKTDYLALDGHSLQLFLAVLEEQSVTAAAERLEMTQSAVSHALKKLSGIVGSPLFVKSGRGIVATAHALRLAEEARDLIGGLEAFARPDAFQPETAALSLVIAASDFQADLLLPQVYKRLSEQTARLELKIIRAGSPAPELLRDRRSDLIISPYPPVGTDIMQRKLMEDEHAVFYDPAVRKPPVTLDEYLGAQHITVTHSGTDRLEFDKKLEAAGINRDIRLRMVGFAGVASFIKGSEMIATMPALLGRSILRGLGQAPMPWGGGLNAEMGRLTMLMAWHSRDHRDPRNMLVRQTLIDVAQDEMRLARS